MDVTCLSLENKVNTWRKVDECFTIKLYIKNVVAWYFVCTMSLRNEGVFLVKSNCAWYTSKMTPIHLILKCITYIMERPNKIILGQMYDFCYRDRNPTDTRRKNNVIITSKNLATSFWRNTDAIITSHVHREVWYLPTANFWFNVN